MGVLIFNKYEKIRRLAEGGMGEVYLARQKGPVGFDRFVILKNLRSELAGQRDFVDQFLDEARVAATLNHPNIVALYEVGEWEGTYYMAMEYIAGADLSHLWYAAAKAGVGLPFQVSVGIIHDAALGLDHAHHATDVHGQPLHVVHRDISPQNIMVRGDGVTKVVDFGIAKASNRMTKTALGVVKGKLQYMSPEQIRGDDLDGRSDQFSLGTVLWELCTGKRLFKAPTELETLNKILQHPMPPPSSVVPSFPAELERIIMRMLERDRDKRYLRLRDAARELKSYRDRSIRSGGEQSVSDFVHAILGDELAARTADLTPDLDDPAVVGGTGIVVRRAGKETLRLASREALEQAILERLVAPDDELFEDGVARGKVGADSSLARFFQVASAAHEVEKVHATAPGRRLPSSRAAGSHSPTASEDGSGPPPGAFVDQTSPHQAPPNHAQKPSHWSSPAAVSAPQAAVPQMSAPDVKLPPAQTNWQLGASPPTPARQAAAAQMSAPDLNPAQSGSQPAAPSRREGGMSGGQKAALAFLLLMAVTLVAGVVFLTIQPQRLDPLIALFDKPPPVAALDAQALRRSMRSLDPAGQRQLAKELEAAGGSPQLAAAALLRSEAARIYKAQAALGMETGDLAKGELAAARRLALLARDKNPDIAWPYLALASLATVDDDERKMKENLALAADRLSENTPTLATEELQRLPAILAWQVAAEEGGKRPIAKTDDARAVYFALLWGKKKGADDQAQVDRFFAGRDAVWKKAFVEVTKGQGLEGAAKAPAPPKSELEVQLERAASATSPSDSLRRYRKLLVRHPRDKRIRAGLGWAYLRGGNTFAARRDFRRALAIDKEYGDALFGAGEAAMAMNRTAEAERYYTRFLAVEPSGERADKARAALSQPR